MVQPVRPLSPGLVPSQAPARLRSPEALAAQRAFFTAALARNGAVAPTAAPAQTVAPRTVAEVAAPISAAPGPASPVQTQPSGNPEAPPPRNLRPGSLIDIKV